MTQTNTLSIGRQSLDSGEGSIILNAVVPIHPLATNRRIARLLKRVSIFIPSAFVIACDRNRGAWEGWWVLIASTIRHLDPVPVSLFAAFFFLPFVQLIMRIGLRLHLRLPCGIVKTSLHSCIFRTSYVLSNVVAIVVVWGPQFHNAHQYISSREKRFPPFSQLLV